MKFYTGMPAELHPRLTHGHTVGGLSPTYTSWVSMHARCKDESARSYKYYGAKGIKVDSRWDDFATFLADMGERPEGTTLDRRESHKDYGPDNCRWSDGKTQNRNRAHLRRHTYSGKSLLLSEWAEETGISFKVLLARVSCSGWDIARAIETPVVTNAQAMDTVGVDESVAVTVSAWGRKRGIGTTHTRRLFNRGELPVRVVATGGGGRIWVVTDPEKFAAWVPPRQHRKRK